MLQKNDLLLYLYCTATFLGPVLSIEISGRTYWATSSEHGLYCGIDDTGDSYNTCCGSCKLDPNCKQHGSCCLHEYDTFEEASTAANNTRYKQYEPNYYFVCLC